MTRILFAGLLLLTSMPGFSEISPFLNGVEDIYKALSSRNVEVIQTQINKVQQSDLELKQAYEGALLMKKSGLLKGPAKQKLAVFKSGRLKLEAAISKEPHNAELRFLRLIIQEHAPKVVKYHNDIKEDAEMIKNQFNNFPVSLQQIIIDYSKHSTALKLP